MKETTKTFAAKMKLGPHHAIERFGVITSIITATFVLLLVSTVISAVGNNRARLDETALYTASFTTSRTELSGSVDGVYTNEEGTRALALMRFDDSAAGSFSTDAANYQAFLTGSNEQLDTQALRTTITGSIVLFGSTGYLGVVLESDAPFEQQIISLTLRANSELVYKEDSGRALREDLQDDGSFAEFDQWRLFLNPGASGTEEAASLAGARIDPSAMYYELVVAEQEEELREAMDEQLMEMSAVLNRIDEYDGEMNRVNVDGVFIEPPEVPVQVDGDAVTGEEADADSEPTLALETDWVHPRGYDFDWRSGSVEEGYLDAIMPEDETSYVTFLGEKARAEDEESSRFEANDMEWYLTDGNDLREYRESGQAMDPLREIMNNTTQAYQDYYRLKTDYQIDSLSNLLELEVTLRSVTSAGSVNAEEEALLTY
ncbi:hypothetical protein HNR06_002602 [Nocardiopsis arvandica]|uniref:Uncharacterized protein n=1 Tax=Nocardiopsis sinuspersici TaxID=501010 RepID=A0A7Z0BIS0_9ACTN|nr:hypothetical protein [Nocardiopsis sinuspersici]NYH53013.1 hypothetical protein [Nocardiopsis sinuspersici]